MACGSCRMGKLNRVAIRGLAVMSRGEVDSLISTPTNIDVVKVASTGGGGMGSGVLTGGLVAPDAGGLAPCPAGQVRSTTGITAGICVPANNGGGNNLKDFVTTAKNFVKEKPIFALAGAFVLWKVLR